MRNVLVSASWTPPKTRAAAIAACPASRATVAPTAYFIGAPGGRPRSISTSPYTASAAHATYTTITSASTTRRRYRSRPGRPSAGRDGGAQCGHRTDLRPEEAPPVPGERLRVAGGQELVRPRRRPLRVAVEIGLHQHPDQVLRRLVGAGDEGDLRPEHDLQDPGEQRVVRAAQHQGVDAGALQRLQVALGEPEHLAPAGHPALDE